ncbi:CAP-Gly domain-containing linker protein 4-like isoform X1 [Asterias rubens]|uniref:CAP-Gly domain-containing linker protein 4-like isoform X1 n=1 Tax=Asterias rubens TaxID=7604 RepID=UPI001455A2D5|nr:CAP-Gly domain-containing linker protein 4-like isoform X1 [Asterias rubens]
MSNAGSNRSLPSSDSATGSLILKLWDKDEFERSGLEIHNLVEDKDVAAKAVTLVVNSSRKGVVSLCADVANILRAKKKLEHTIELQHKELLRLRRNGQLTVGGDSNRTSRSTSPTPPSPRSFESSLMQQRHSSHLALSRSTSICSQCSSLSSSPRLERAAFNQSKVSTESHDSGTHHHLELLPNQYVVTAEVHRTSSACSSEDAQSYQKSPETKRKTVETFSKEVQCSSLSDENRELEKKHQDVCAARERLEDSLQKARKEIEDLKTRLYISEDIREEHQSMICDLSIENEVKGGWTETSRTDTDSRSETSINLPLLSPRDHGNQCWQGNGLVSENHSNPYPSPPHPPVQQHFVSGCLCIPCQKQMQEGARQNAPSQGQTVIRGGNHRFTVHIDDRVATKGDRVGLIRYIGHLESTNSSHTVYAGLELEAPAGRHDGFINGKRYFWCHRNHGLFVPLQDIVAIVNKKATKRPKTVDVSRHREHRGHSKHQQSGRPVDLKHKSGNRTSSGKKLISADSTSLKRSSSLPAPSIT